MGQRPKSAVPENRGSLEKRLQDARLKRQEALSAKSSGAVVEAGGDKVEPAGAAEKPTAPSERTTMIPWLRAKVSGTTARHALLAFSVAAGLGFGVALGLGVLAGVGILPLRNVDTAPAPAELRSMVTTEALDAPVAVVENEPETPVEVVAEDWDTPNQGQPVVASVELPGAGLEASLKPAPEPERGPDVFTAISYPLALTAPVSTPVAVPAIAADAAWAEEEVSFGSAPALHQPDRPIALSDTVTFGGEPSPRVQYFMHVPTGVSATALQTLVSRLDQSGVAVAEIGRENFRVSATHIRFYSPETAEAARTVAAELGVEARDFSENFGDINRVEIWVAGRPGSRPASEAGDDKRFDSSTAPYDVSNTDR